MSVSIRPFNIDFAIKTVEGIAVRRLASIADQEIRNDVVKCIYEEFHVIPQFITSSEQLYNTLWERIRTGYSKSILEFLMPCTSEMLMRFLSHGWTNEIIANFFIETVPFNNGKSSSIDENLQGMLLTREEAKELFTENAWYIFIVILTMTEVRANMIENFADAAKKNNNGKGGAAR